MAFNPAYADSIAAIESGGNYGIIGPAVKSGDHAYGKYQIMGSNIGPWSKEILGTELTPQQFLANPQYQDAIFQGKFGQYVDKYGPEGAAQAWFGGPGAVGKTDRTDQLGTSVGAYGKRFMAGLGADAPPVGDAPQMTASLPQQPLENSQAPQQRPLQPQPLNLAQLPLNSATPQEAALPQAPPLNAPQLLPVLRQLNQLRAFQNIPLPQGFKGFSYT